MEAEKRANPGYRAFLANGFNVTRALVLFGWEVVAGAGRRRRARRAATCARAATAAASIRCCAAAMCVIVRDLIVFGVLTDMMRGRPAVYATFSSYDEVAHHSGLERADTLEALRKLDQQFGRIDRARRYAPRPYEIVVLSDHGQTQGATFKQRNGYGLDELVERSLDGGDVRGLAGGDEQSAMVGARRRRGDRPRRRRSAPKNDVSDRDVVVLGSGNLGLVYLMEEQRRLTLEEIDERHPELIPALREHPHVGWLLVRSREHGAVVLGARGAHHLADGRVEGEDPLAPSRPTAPQHLLRTDGFAHVADIMVGSFYDPELDEGCAFEELISLPRRPRRPADAAVHPLPGDAAAAPTSRSSAPPRCTACCSGWRRQDRIRRAQSGAHHSPGSDDAVARGRKHDRGPTQKEEPMAQTATRGTRKMGRSTNRAANRPGRQPKGDRPRRSRRAGRPGSSASSTSR